MSTAEISVARGMWDLGADGEGALRRVSDEWAEHAQIWGRSDGHVLKPMADLYNGGSWTDETAQTYRRHLIRLSDSVVAAGALAGRVVDVLTDTRAALFDARRDLKWWLRSLSGIPVQRTRSELRFRPRTEAQASQVRAAVMAAGVVKGALDVKLRATVDAFRGIAAEFDEIAGTWDSRARHEQPIWVTPPEPTGGPASITMPSGTVVVNPGSGGGDDRVLVGLDPSTGEQIVTVNGHPVRVPADSGLTVHTGAGDDVVTADRDFRYGLTAVTGRGEDVVHGGTGDEQVFTGPGAFAVDGGPGETWTSRP